MSGNLEALKRDFERFRYLLQEMSQRLSEVGHDSSIGDIGPLVREAEMLAPKLGFEAPPVTYAERKQPHCKEVRFLIWNDPHATRGGEIILSAPSENAPKLDLVAKRSKARDRKRLESNLNRWLRAIEGLHLPTIASGKSGGEGRGGSKPSYDAEADAKLAQKWWQAKGKGGLTLKEFAKEQGLTYYRVKLALDRHRHRQRN